RLQHCSAGFSCVLCFLLLFVVFFLLLLRPPTSTLFPTRRSSDLIYQQPKYRRHIRCLGTIAKFCRTGRCFHCDIGISHTCYGLRSEEHTSELQSRFDIVCRLLLEKKNKLPPTPIT